MAVSVTSDTDKSGTGTSITWTSFAVSGSNPVIVVLIAAASVAGTQDVSSVTVSAGLSGTTAEIKDLTGNSSAAYGSIWVIKAPSGTGTITANLAVSGAYLANAILMAGADQTDPMPVADAVTTKGATNPLSVTPTNLTANDAAVGFGCNAVAGDAPRFQQTETFFDNALAVNGAFGYHLGTGAISVLWGTPDDVDILLGARVVAATLPVLTSIDPVEGAQGATGLEVTLTGSSFAP